MRILFISAANSIHTVKWVNEFSKKGCEVILISLKNHRNLENNIDKRIKIIYLPIKGKIGYYLNAIFVNKIIKKIKPDVINVHYASGYGTLGRFLKFEKKLLNVWGSDIYDFPNQSKIKKKILIKNLEAYRFIASTSKCMAEETKKYMKKNQEIFITPFGVDIERFKSFNKERKDNKIKIGIVKTLLEKYGIEYLIRAIYDLKTLISEEEFKKIEVNIYGVGDLRGKLEEISKKLELSDKIFFRGYISNELVPDALNEMDIFVAPSINESFGVAAVEAMACELPVIVSNADGLKEVVENNKTGFIVETKNSKAIAEKIKLLINEKELRKKIGKEGRERVKELYDWEKNVEKMLDIYRKITIDREKNVK